MGVAVLEFSPDETTDEAVETIAETAFTEDGRCLGTDAWALDRRRRPQSSVGIGIRASVNRLTKSSRMLLFVLAEHSITWSMERERERPKKVKKEGKE